MLRTALSLASTALLAFALGCGGGGGGSAIGPTAGTTAVQAALDTLSGTTAAAFRFLGQASDPTGAAVSYAWDFDGDGTVDETGQSPSFTFATAGTRTVRLTATDAAGRANTADLVLGVTDPAAPTAPLAPAVVLRVWTLHGSAPAEVFCWAQAEDPDGGSITDYAFDIDGDGTPEVSGASPTATLTLLAAGVYEASVTVTDDEAATSTARATLVLCEGAGYPDQSPAAMILVPAGQAWTDTSTALDLVAVGGDIDGGALTSIEWDLDGDGVFGDLTGRAVSASFASEGVHRVRVRLVDDDGSAPAEAALDVLVSDLPPTDGRPGAWAVAEAVVAAPAQAIQFRAAAVGGNAPLTFSWDFDGDGSEDASAADPVFAFGIPGAYRPRLTVTDADGDVATSELSLLVERCGASAAPFFRYESEDVLLLHGGTAALLVAPVVTAGSAPTMYGLLWKSGPAAEDPAAGDLDVQDDQMQALPPATTPVAVPPGGIVPLDLTSLAVDGPQRLTCYSLGLRLVDPGVRVQVLTCQVCVAHGLVQADLFRFAFPDTYRGLLRAWVDVGAFGTLPGTPPQVHEVAFSFAAFTPALLEVVGLGSAFLQGGWSEEGLAGEHRFFTSTNPIPATGSMYSWQFDFDTNVGPGRGPAVSAGEVLLRDANGRLIGRQTLLFP